MNRIDTGQFGPETIAGFVARYPSQPRFVVAFSGGPDSLSLLHAFARIRDRDPRLRLCAVHVDHHLHPDSTRWARQCREVCRGLSVELTVRDADVAVGNAGRGTEGAARAARYRVLERMVSPGDVLCTAHTRDDHAETVLLNLLRGAGPRGLAGIPSERRLGAGIVARPVLGVSRSELRAYARETGLPMVHDPANEAQRNARVLLRQTVLPALEARWPGVRSRLEHAAEMGRECATLLDALAAIDLESAGGVGAESLETDALGMLELPRRRNAVAAWLRSRGIAVPGARRIEQVARAIVEARQDASPCVSLGDVEARRYRGRIHLVPRARPVTVHDVRWRLPEPLELGHGSLALERCRTGGLDDSVRRTEVVVRFRRDDASSMRPPGVRGHSLKKRFQALGIPPWERGRVPLVYAGDVLAAIGAVWTNPRLHAARGTPGWRVVWTPLSGPPEPGSRD